ncbi:cohesin subunit SA-2-like, partial [Ctenocephalides felis]|uniref:cohesin subunit SA-2-like n=1 Tax=Ctenocephalides felis TaxID=7515 RepID=UPI000E6E52E4
MLTCLSKVKLQILRYTSTLAGIKLMTALAEIESKLSVNCNYAIRQVEAEEAKDLGRQMPDRLETLIEKRDELLENQEELQKMIKSIFKYIFTHRYKDFDPDIRANCLAELGIWLNTFHSQFLDDAHLKFIGFSLFDK